MNNITTQFGEPFGMPPAGTIGYQASIDRPSSSRANRCETEYYATRLEAVTVCIESIDRNRVRVKPSDTITTFEFTATGDGGWQCEMMMISEKSETVTVAAARDAVCAAYRLRQGPAFFAATA